jgi:membrane protease YdiL (CAAX protease family)
MAALTNLFLAGVLLCVAYERYGRLWFPIGIHFGWNILSGPILDYDVSGYVSAASVWRMAGSGPPWLTGGAFGIEGSVWIGVMEVAAIGCLNMMARPRRYGVSEETE